MVTEARMHVVTFVTGEEMRERGREKFENQSRTE
jgi:hypothetical protein